MSKEQEQLLQWIDESDNIVFFGGAGVSTESKIPDFRSVDGLYKQNYDYPPETILSHSFYIRNPEEFYRFYRDKMLFPDAEPNAAHIALANLEKQGKLKAVITQNIDGLHQKAGSKEVLELHGSVLRNHCTHCHKFYSLEDILAMDGVPHCECGGIIKPDVVLYEEGLDMPLSLAALLSRGAPLPFSDDEESYHNDYTYQGDKLVLINKDKTSKDNRANLILHEPIGEVLKPLA